MSVKNKGVFNFDKEKLKEQFRENKNLKWAVIMLAGMVVVTIISVVF